MREQGCIVTMVSISENGNGDIAGVPMTKVFTQMVERENVIKYLLECLIKIIFLTKCLIKIILTMKVKKPKFYNNHKREKYSSGPLIQEAFRFYSINEVIYFLFVHHSIME